MVVWLYVMWCGGGDGVVVWSGDDGCDDCDGDGVVVMMMWCGKV